MNPHEIFAAKLYEHRKEKRLTQEEMAELCGVSTRHYQNLEAGKVNSSIDNAVRILKRLDLNLELLKEDIVK